MTAALSNPCLIPFLIGVTGHRDLRPQDTAALEGAVESVFKGFRKRLPSTPVVLLSGLAAGADQLAARVALRCGMDLAAVLPMPVGVYRTTMDAEGCEQFDRLLAQASLVIRLPNAANVTEARLAEFEEARAEQYEELAVFLAIHSQALVALWDGTPSDAQGGTYRVIRYVLGDPPQPADSAWEPQAGVVYRIATPRESHTDTAGSPFEVKMLTSLDASEPVELPGFKAIEQSLDEFNRDAGKRNFGKCGAAGGLVNEECAVSLSSFGCRAGQCYRAADDSSFRFNKQTKVTLLWLLCFALTAITAFEVYAHVFSRHFALWLVYPASLVGAWVVYRFTLHRGIEVRYLDYRALAEALRVQFFWSLAGIRRSAADYYLVHHRTELDWIRYALRAISLFQWADAEAEGAREKEIRLVLEHWVKDQRQWYTNKSKQQKAALDRVEQWSGGSLLGVWLLSLVIPLSLLVPWERLAVWRSFASSEPWLGGLMLVTSLPSIAIGLVRVWMEQGGYGEQARTYNRMAHVFEHAEKRIERDLQERDPAKANARQEDAREVLHRLGIQALEENGDWLLLHRDRPLRVVGG